MNLGRDSSSFKISEGKDNEGREYAIRSRQPEGRKEGRRSRRSTANFWMQITVVSKGGTSRMKTREGGGMQIESCYRRLLRLRPNLRHLNMTRETTPFSRRGKCEFNVRRQSATKRSWFARVRHFFSGSFWTVVVFPQKFFAEISVKNH